MTNFLPKQSESAVGLVNPALKASFAQTGLSALINFTNLI